VRMDAQTLFAVRLTVLLTCLADAHLHASSSACQLLFVGSRHLDSAPVSGCKPIGPIASRQRCLLVQIRRQRQRDSAPGSGRVAAEAAGLANRPGQQQPANADVTNGAVVGASMRGAAASVIGAVGLLPTT